MLERFKHLIGLDESRSEPESSITEFESSDLITEYFRLSEEITRAKSAGDFASAVKAARKTYPILAEVMQEWVRANGQLMIMTSHAVHTAPTLMAVLEERVAIQDLRTTLEAS